MDISKDYMCSEGSDAAIILMLGSGGNNALTKGVSKWLVKQGVNVLSLGASITTIPAPSAWIVTLT